MGSKVHLDPRQHFIEFDLVLLEAFTKSVQSLVDVVKPAVTRREFASIAI